MREIKFRAYDPTNERMVYDGFYINEDGSIEIFMDIFYENYMKTVDWILMEYTGLTDRNSVDIYEGDIVKTKRGLEIVFMRFGCWFVEHQKELGYFKKCDIEVVGNIHEAQEEDK